MTAPSLRWRRTPPSWTGGVGGYDLGRNPEEDGEPFATVQAIDGGGWMWHGRVRGHSRNTAREDLPPFPSAAAAQADALLWVRSRLGL